MAVSKLWGPYTATLGATHVNTRDVSWSLGLRTAIDYADGEVSPTYLSLVEGKPSARITTVDLAAALGAVALTGLAISSGTGVIYSRKYAQGGTRTSSATAEHHKITFNTGLAVLRRISARQGEAATLEIEVMGRKESSTAPVTFSETTTLPASTPGTDLQWTVGPVSLNGAIEGVESVEVDFGVDVLSETKDGDIYPTYLSIRRIAPSVRIRTTNMDLTTSLTEEGGYYTASQVVIYLRKRAEGGTFVADGTSAHVSMTFGKCRVEVVSAGGDPRVLELLVTPIGTSGNTDAVAIATTATIA